MGVGEEKDDAEMNKVIPAVSRTFESRWGWAGVAATDQGLCLVILPRRSREEAQRALVRELRQGGFAEEFPKADARRSGAERSAKEAVEQVRRYLNGTARTIDLRLDLRKGTPFQQKVWRLATEIPYGCVRSYGWLAARLGGRRYARAVGMALGANPVPLIVPCHRIVSHDGSLGGFSGGLPIKRKLLALEGSLAQVH